MNYSLETRCAAVMLVCLPAIAAAQATPGTLLPPAQQVAAAVAAAPAELRDGAAVLGYREKGKLVTLREGKNDMVCLADDPSIEQFHVACYHKALEPFMARGRSLRAEGVKGEQVDTVRFKEFVDAVGAVYAYGRELRPGDVQGHGREVAVRRVHPGCHDGVDGHHGEASEGRPVDHVPGDAKGPHHVLYGHVRVA
jgi:hypothetical protein